MNPVLIESSVTMSELVARLENEYTIAVDTEFIREKSYYPQLALVQIATDSYVACIDPLAFDARAILREIFLDEQRTKVFHSCSQDLEVLYYYLGEVPVCVHDTQIAHALLSDHHQISYATLVEKELGVRLDKSQTRTNWLQRPLTSRQLDYAGDDVFYLYRLYRILEKKLQEAGRKEWFAEDCAALTSTARKNEFATEDLWKRVRGTGKLSTKDLAVVQAIAEWREHIAREKNKPRRTILADEAIVSLALDPPVDLSDLTRFMINSYRTEKKQREQLLISIKSALQMPADKWPDNRYSVLDSQQKELLKVLQQLVSRKAEELGLSTAILCSRKELEKLILLYTGDNTTLSGNQPGNPDVTSGWRFHCIGQTLMETLKKSVNNGCLD